MLEQIPLKRRIQRGSRLNMSLGVLTGRPAEEMPGSTGDQLPELVQLLERVRQAMSGVV